MIKICLLHKNNEKKVTVNLKRILFLNITCPTTK